MSEWKGLDPGGTEQLWDATVLGGVLELLKPFEPFSRGASESPIFDELEEEFPEITWRGWGKDGSFRTIFRKTNPWVKLGLMEPDTVDASITPLGDELISGEKLLSEVFVEAVKNHVEPDGTRSFAVMCQAALDAPKEVFSLEDIEYGVSADYATGGQPLEVVLAEVRSRELAFPAGSRRPRTIRAFMNALVSAGALINVKGGWALNQHDVAREIAGIFTASPTPATAIATDLSVAPPVGGSSRTFKVIAAGKRATPTFDLTVARDLDPIKRALLLEKANSIHESLVETCANIVRALGLNPVEDTDSFDLAVVEKQLMVEVKSIHGANAVTQLRKALAQLAEYRWKHGEVFSSKSALLILTDQDPTLFVESGYLSFIEDDRGIAVFWREGENVVNSAGRELADYISALDVGDTGTKS